MSSVFKDKSKANPLQKIGTEPPSIRVEEMPPELPRERPFRPRVKDKLKHFFSIRSSSSRAASRGPSERGKAQEYLPAGDTTVNLNVGDKNRPVEIKNDLSESLKQTERQMGSQQSDKGKGNNEADGADGAGGLESLAAMPGHSYHDYDKIGIPEVDDREIVPCDQFPDIGTPSGQENAHVSTQDVVSQLHGAHHFTIGGNPRFENIRVKNEYNYANHTGNYDITVLKEFVSFGALYNSAIQDPTRCVHPGTRQHVLKLIKDWIDTPNVKERIFWLHGPAGVGKSAIAQTIARSCAKDKLVATFFFYRSDPGRTDGNRLFTTLAWQFASSIPATKSALIQSLNECPDTPVTDVETQFEELIVKPFLQLKASRVQLSAPVVIIDGVDECSDDSLQRRLLKIIGNAVKDDRIPLRFLICSRPEAHIQDTIDIFRSVTLPLDLAKLDDANHDIEKYLRAEFSRIATEQDLDSAWPGEHIIKEFVYKASGQFIYAFTVVKYLGDEYSSAETQLDIIRGLKPPSSISPFAELDELYKEILRRQRDPVFLKDFLSLFIGRNGMYTRNLHQDDAMLMNISEKELHRKLRGMRSLLKFNPCIDVHHRSFLDFLQDSSRSGQYHISKQAGARRYLDFIAGSLVRYASTMIEGHDDHTHFNPRFHDLAAESPEQFALPVEEWQQALQPLVDLHNKLLTLPNFRSIWEFMPCEGCIGFRNIRDLLLHLAFLLGASDRILGSPLLAESYAEGSEERSQSSIIHLTPTEPDTNVLDKDLNACLSSLLPRLRREKSGISFGTDTIQLVCSLLHFNHTEIAMKLRSISDAQNLVDIIDELINSKYFCSDYSADISCKAVHLALEIYSRVPVLPRSLFWQGTVGPHHDDWPIDYDPEPTTEVLSQIGFMCRILDSRYIVRVSWAYKDTRIWSLVDKVNENSESLSQWRIRSNPSSIARIRVMLEVAKALRYFHSMGIIIHYALDSDDIFLDSELQTRFRFLGLTTRYINVTLYRFLSKQFNSRETNIFLLGCLLYEMCFDIKIDHYDRLWSRTNAVAERHLTPEIRDDTWELIQRCCAKERKSRPTMDEVVREMEAWNYVGA